MKKLIFVFVLISLLLLGGCDAVFPTNTATPVTTSTPTPVPLEPTATVETTATPTTEATYTPTATTVVPTPAATPVVPTPAPTNDLAGLSEINPTIYNVADYMQEGYYKPGDGFEDAVSLTYVTSSSYLAEQAGNTYKPENLYDFNLDTVWCEGRSDYGIGEWALYKVKAVDYAPDAVITKLEIINGYIKNDNVFYDNSMVKKMLVIVDNQNWCVLNFVISKEIQVFDIPDIDLSTTDNTSIKFVILDVYEGDVYKDTCITAIEFLGTGIY